MSDDFDKIGKLFISIIKDNIDSDAFIWLEKAGLANEADKLGQAFVLLPRKTGKNILKINTSQSTELEELGLSYLSTWTIDRLARVWLLSTHSFQNPEKYHPIIENLFLSAEMNEAVALYSALPFLANPESWVKRCAEGIRSNIGSVLEAIMENNPYPAAYLNEAAWNQLVLKAFFTEKNIEKIQGIDNRANQELALTLSDYARERYAAGRTVNPQLWRFTSSFINDKIFEAIKIGLKNVDVKEHDAIAIAVSKSSYEPAKAYIREILG